MEKPIDKIPTPNQARLMELIVESYGKRGKRRSLGSMLLEAGYSPESAKNPKQILAAPVIQELVGNLAQDFENKGKSALGHITEKKLKGAGPSTLIYVASESIKVSRLIAGKSTANIAGYIVTDSDKKELDFILSQHKKSLSK